MPERKITQHYWHIRQVRPKPKPKLNIWKRLSPWLIAMGFVFAYVLACTLIGE